MENVFCFKIFTVVLIGGRIICLLSNYVGANDVTEVKIRTAQALDTRH